MGSRTVFSKTGESGLCSYGWSSCAASAHQSLQRGHDAEGNCRDNALELAHLAEEAEEAEGPEDPQLLDPAVGPTTKALVL